MGCLRLNIENPASLKVLNGGKSVNPKTRECSYRYAFNGMEKDDEVKGQGNSYDFGARMYDSRVGRWMSRDAHESKYPDLSPYVFVANTPIVAIDPDGKDVIILVAKDGASGLGHMAMIIQDKNGNWYYFTQGGAGAGGLSKMMTSGIQGGVALESLGTTDASTAIRLAKQDKSNKPYTSQVRIKTSKEMDEEIYDKAKEVANSTNMGEDKYNLLFNNCVDACQDVIQEAIDLPLDIDPRPNKYFEKLENKLDKIQRSVDKDIKREIDKQIKVAEKQQKVLDKEQKKNQKSKEKEDKKQEEKDKSNSEDYNPGLRNSTGETEKQVK
jgi:RHS repeat-associated protein